MATGFLYVLLNLFFRSNEDFSLLYMMHMKRYKKCHVMYKLCLCHRRTRLGWLIGQSLIIISNNFLDVSLINWGTLPNFLPLSRIILYGKCDKIGGWIVWRSCFFIFIELGAFIASFGQVNMRSAMKKESNVIWFTLIDTITTWMSASDLKRFIIWSKLMNNVWSTL